MNNEELVKHLVGSGVLRTPEIIEAFRKVDRKDFVRDGYREYAYEDIPLPIGFGQTISQPYTVAFMLELLKPLRGMKVLDIGSGSGWSTALLSECVGREGKVIGLEIVPELLRWGQNNVSKYKFSQANIRLADKNGLGMVGGVFDRILLSASTTKIPKSLLGQLKINGRLVIPINDEIRLVEKSSKKELKQKGYKGFAFVPLII